MVLLLKKFGLYRECVIEDTYERICDFRKKFYTISQFKRGIQCVIEPEKDQEIELNI